MRQNCGWSHANLLVNFVVVGRVDVVVGFIVVVTMQPPVLRAAIKKYDVFFEIILQY